MTTDTLTINMDDGVTPAANTARASLSRFTDQATKTAEVMSVTESKITRAGSSIDAVTRKIDGNFAATAKLEGVLRRYEAQVAAVTAQHNAEGGSAEQLAEKLRRLGVVRDQDIEKARAQGAAIEQRFEAAAASTRRLGTATGATADQMRQLAPQINDVITSLAGGASPIMVLTQQGGQITQIFGGVRGTLAAAAAALGPLGIAAIAAGAALATIGGIAEAQSSRMSNLRQQLRATHDDYAALATQVDATARRVAASSTLSRSEATAAGQTVASAKYFGASPEELERLTRLSADLAKVWNVDVAQASGVLRSAIDNPAAAARKFAEDGLPGFDLALARSIDLMQSSGRGGQAFQVVLEGLSKASAGASRDVSPLTKAVHDLEQTFYGARDGGKSLADNLGGFLNKQLAYVVIGFTDVVRWIEKAGSTAAEWIERAQKGIASLPNSQESEQARSRANATSLQRSQPTGGNAATTPDATGREALLGPPIAGRSERAVGIFQVLPSTARGYGLDPYVQDQNIVAGLRTFQDFSRQAGTVDGGLARYGGYGNEVARAQGYIGRVAAADVSKLPADLAGQIEFWGQTLGMSPEMIAVGKRIAVVESGGRQYASAGTTAAPPVSVSRGGFDQASIAPLGTTPNDIFRAGLSPTDRESIDTAQRLNEQLGLLVDRRAKLIADRAGVEKALRIPNQAPEEYERLRASAQSLTGQINDTITEQAKLARASADAVAPLEAEAGAARELAKIRQQFVEASRSSGQPIDQAALYTAQANKLRELGTAFDDNVKSIQRDAEANERIASTLDGSAASFLAATNREKALADARTAYLAGPDREAAIERETKALNRQTASVADRASVQKSFDQRDQLQILQLETASLGLNEDARNKDIALLKAKQDLLRQGANLESAASQASLANVAAIADATTALNQQKASLAELSSFFDNTFNTIGNAITSAFATGEISAIKFGDIAKSVASAITAEFVKLALLNPLKNALFGKTDPTLSSVGGVLGDLFGSSSSISTSDPASFVVGGAVAGAAGLVYNSEGFETDPSGLDAEDKKLAGKVGKFGADGSVSFTDTAQKGLSGLSTLNFLSGGKLLEGAKTFVLDAVGFTPGQSIGSWVSSLIGETTATTATASTGVGVGVLSEGLADAATAAGGAAAAGGVGASTGAIGAAVQTIAEALPYIGAAIAVITDLATGNLRGAAIVAGAALAGAAIGTWVFPGIGTAAGAAIGAVVGGFVDAFFPQHPKNPYQDTQVDIVGGRIVAGRQVSQIETTDAASASVTQFGEQLGTYLDKVGVRITNADGLLGHVGQNITGLEQFDSVAKLFDRLRFDRDPNDTTNFGIAKGAVAGRQFADIGALNAALFQAAKFADGMDQLGIKLAAVGSDLTNISIASVSLTGALNEQAGVAVNADGTIADAAFINDVRDPATDKPDLLRVALSHALVGQVFANVDALSAEIDKANTFVNGTLPGMLNPVVDTTSSIVEAVAKTTASYGDAINQAAAYGLETDKLAAAQQKAVDMIRAPGLTAIAAANEALAVRLAASAGGAQAAAAKSLADFDAGVAGQRDQLKKLWTDTYDDITLTSHDYLESMNQLERTMGAERVALARQVQVQQRQALLSLQQTVTGVGARDLRLRGNNQGADLAEFDAKAASERLSYQEAYVATFGTAYLATADYQERMTQLERVQQGERAAIVKKYGDQATADVKQAADAQAQAAKEAADAQKQAAEAAMQAARATADLRVRLLSAVGETALAEQYRTNLQNAETRRGLNSGDVLLFDLTVAMEAAAAATKSASEMLTEALSKQTAALQQQMGELRSNTDALKSGVAGLLDFNRSLATSAASPLSPAQRLAAAKEAMTADLRIVADPSKDQAARAQAAQQLQADAQTRLQAAEAYFGKATPGYAAEYGATRDGVDAAASFLASSQSVGERSLLVLRAQLQLTQSYADQAAAQSVAQRDLAAQGVAAARENLTQALSLADRQIGIDVISAQTQLQQALALSDQQVDATGRTAEETQALRQQQVEAAQAALAQQLRLADQQYQVDDFGNALLGKNKDTVYETAQRQLKASLDAADAQRAVQEKNTAIITAQNGDLLTVDKQGNLILEATGAQMLAATQAGTAQTAALGTALATGFDAMIAAVLSAQATQQSIADQLALQVAESKRAAQAAADTASAQAAAALSAEQARSEAARQVAAEAQFRASQKDATLALARQIDAFFNNVGPPPAAAPGWSAPDAAHVNQDYTGQLTIQSRYIEELGRMASGSEIDYWFGQISQGLATFVDLANWTRSTSEAVAYRASKGLQAGGWVGNGQWDRDSVVAAYAGGGSIALAGGEYVVTAPQAARYGDVLPSINAGTYRAANDTGMAAELRALRVQVAQLVAGQQRQTQVTAAGAVEVAGAVRERRGAEIDADSRQLMAAQRGAAR